MRKLGWVRPLRQFPANYWKPSRGFPTSYPSKFSIDCEHLPATDTGDEPASHIHAVCSALDIAHNSSKSGHTFHPSPSFIRRSMFHEPTNLAGDLTHSITDVIRHIQTYGYVSESDCPYEQGCELDPLTDELTNMGRSRRSSQWANISLSNQIFKLALLDRCPIVCGIIAFERIESIQDSQDAFIALEPADRWPMTGMGLCITGWDDTRQCWRVRTPFGALWGDNGYGWIPYPYLTQTGTSDDHYCLVSI